MPMFRMLLSGDVTIQTGKKLETARRKQNLPECFNCNSVRVTFHPPKVTKESLRNRKSPSFVFSVAAIFVV